jgi:tetratricopeptide (TPR) repeat protein
MSKAADLARSEFGAEHWLTKLKDSLATGLKSLAILPEPQKQLFIEAARSQSLSGYLYSNGKRDRALAQIRQARDQRDQAVGSEHILSAYFLLGLVYSECQMGDFRSGQRDADAAVSILKTAWGEKNPGYAHALYYQAIAEAGLRDLDQAEQHFREALEILEPVAREGISNHFLLMYAGVQLQLAKLLNGQERFAEAEPFARRSSELHAFAPRQTYLEGQLDLARSLSGQGKDAEAEILFTCLIRAVQPNPPPHVMAHILALYAEHLRRVHRDTDADQLETLIQKISAKNAGPKSIDERAPEATPLADIPKGTRRK